MDYSKVALVKQELLELAAKGVGGKVCLLPFTKLYIYSDIMAGDKKVKDAPAKKKTAGDDTQLVPLILKFFKVSGVAFSVWLLGYTQFSPSWLLIGAALYMWRDKHVSRKHLQMRIQQQLARDEEATIMARVEDLPSWVSNLHLIETLELSIHACQYTSRIIFQTVAKFSSQ